MGMIIVSFFFTIIFLGWFLISLTREKERIVMKRLDSHGDFKDKQKKEKAQKEKRSFKSIIKGGIKPLKKRLREYYNNTTPTLKEEEIQKRLLNAGSPLRMTVADYCIINNTIRVITPLLFGGYAILVKFSLTNIIIMVFIGFILSFKALDYYISLKTRDRHKKALRELPDFLDVLTISVEAGLGFDLALSKTIENKRGIVPLEFNICLEEMRIGKMRKEALLGVKERLAFDEMISFINSIIQSEKLGTSIVQTLRARSEDERDKRKQRAEEAAMKTTIKILIPLVFCIFPSIFIITFGPAAVQLIKNLSTLK